MDTINIYMEGEVYDISQLPKVAVPITFREKVISFCQQWAEGKGSFEIQTSGSTGKPKLIQLDRSSMIASAMATANALNLKKGQTSLVCLDPAYIAGMMMLVRSIETGMNIIAVEPSANPFEILDDNTSVDFTALVPYQLKAILDSPQEKHFHRFTKILIGGAALDEHSKSRLQKFSCQFYETYGMTETISHIALKKVNGETKSSYFELLPGITIRQDERACLCIQAPYLKEEIVTNDVVELKSLTEFLWLGRNDNVINSGGVKIFPESTEKKLEGIFSQLKIDNLFFIAGLPDVRLGQSVALIVEGHLSTDQQLQLKTRMKSGLSKFEIPRAIQFAPQFVKTETGKINRTKTMGVVLAD
jgi:o-succinylbenzoate---CoA ligase